MASNRGHPAPKAGGLAATQHPVNTSIQKRKAPIPKGFGAFRFWIEVFTGCWVAANPPALGAGRPRFESEHPDHFEQRDVKEPGLSYLLRKQGDAGSNPAVPTNCVVSRLTTG